MSVSHRVVLEVRAAKDSEETPEAMVQFLAGLTGALKSTWWMELWRTQPTITLEIASLRQSVYYIITCDERNEPLVRSQLAAQYRTAMITRMDDYLPGWSRYGQRYAQQLVMKAPSYMPFKTYNKFTSTDPMVGLLGVLSKLPRDTAGIVQIVLSKAPGGWTSTGRTIIKQGIGSDPLKTEAHPQKALIEEKIGSPAFWAGVRLLGVASTAEMAQIVVGQMAGSFGTFAMTEGNGLVMAKRAPQPELVAAVRERSMSQVPRGQYMNLIELASLFHLPNASMSALKNIAWGKSIKGEPPDSLPVEEEMNEAEKKETTFFARTEYKNRMSNFGVKLKDRRRHFYILGKSGTGKSTLIANMAAVDMANGMGLGIIDPHGDLCDILLDYVPDDRVDDVIYLDPSDINNPFRLNPLEVKRPEHKELVASGIVSIFAKIFHYSWGPRLEYILRNTLMTLVEVPGTTLIDVVNILTNDRYRETIVARLPADSIVLKNFWEKEYNEYPDKLKTEAIAPILNKVGQFVGSPTIRRIIATPTSTVNLEDIMNSGKILLLNLSQGKLGEDNATLLGAMFITQFQQAAMNRVNILEEDRKDFFLYVDEFQNFATTSFIKILSEARKYRLGLVLANQYTAQLPEEIQSAIFGNVGSVATFVVGADDAARLMKEFGGLYTQDDLVSLDKFQIITKVAVDNRISGAFPAYTLPLPEFKTANREKVVEKSRALYTSTIETMQPTFFDTMAGLDEEDEDDRPKRNNNYEVRNGNRRFDDRRNNQGGQGGQRDNYRGGGDRRDGGRQQGGQRPAYDRPRDDRPRDDRPHEARPVNDRPRSEAPQRPFERPRDNRPQRPVETHKPFEALFKNPSASSPTVVEPAIEDLPEANFFEEHIPSTEPKHNPMQHKKDNPVVINEPSVPVTVLPHQEDVVPAEKTPDNDEKPKDLTYKDIFG
jgi:hypothetical protein